MQKKKRTTKNKDEKPQAKTAKKSAPAGKRGAPPAKAQKSGLFKFRRYKKVEGGKKKKAKHPKLIVEEKKDKYGFMGLTESSKRGHHQNIELKQNPERGNTEKAYIRKEIRYDDIDKFSEILDDYNLSPDDKAKVIAYIEKLNKKE